MCGIAGIVRWDGRPVLEYEIRDMCGVMVHRGPDEEGIYLADGVALGDERKQQLLLARDRLGIKPMYYAQTRGGIAFASELKPILQLPEISRSVNWEAAGHLFTFLATPSAQSIVDGVAKLEPARI